MFSNLTSKKIIRATLYVSGLFLFACTQNQKQNYSNSFDPRVVETKGYEVPKDSIVEPKVVQAENPKIVQAGNPRVIATNTNVFPVGTPKIVVAGISRVCTPGQDTFLLPEIVTAIDSAFLAGIPEVAIAKDPFIKDQNPQNFSSFSKLQGLKHDIVRCMLQDKSGNIWLGTDAGVSKYDGKSFTHYTEKEGLCQNNVRCILEDKRGNLWFGTLGEGVSKYDGKSFTHYSVNEGLTSNFILSMLEDKNGNIWLGTDGGISKYDPSAKQKKGLVSFTQYTQKQGLSNNTVMTIFEDRAGNIWFGTDGGVSKFDGKSFTHYTKTEGLIENIVLSILEDKNGVIWFGTAAGVCSYTAETVKVENSESLPSGQAYFTNFPANKIFSESVFLSIAEDRNGNLWFGTLGEGVVKYDGKNFTHYNEKEGLSNNTAWDILEDVSGNLWFATYGGGISKYDGKIFTHFTEKEGLSGSTVLSLAVDKNNNLWIGTDDAGVLKYDGKTYTNFTEAEGLLSNYVRVVFEDKAGNFWFGTDGIGISKYNGKTFTHYTEKEGLCDNTIFSILEDSNGNMWFGTDFGINKFDGKTFTHYTTAQGLTYNTVRTIVEDKKGNLWFATDGGGVSKFDGKRFTNFTEKEGLSNNNVLSMLEDKQGNMWFGSIAGGVSKYDGKHITHYTEKEGLLNNAVLSMIEDKKGDLWFGTRFGLSKLDLKKLEEATSKNNKSLLNQNNVCFKNYTYEDGFLGIGVNGGKTICEDKNGTIWIAANDRLTAYHPEGEFVDTIAPNIQLTSIGLFNERIKWTDLMKSTEQNLVKDTSFALGNGVSVGGFEFTGISKWYSLPENLSLAYNNNYLNFNFIGITQKQNKKVKYQYKLEGIDENWSAITNRTEAAYGNLPHGTFTFKVKAMNSEGYWSNEYNYTFTIRPPWWKTWWMYLLYVCASIASIVLIVWWNGRRLRKRAEELKEEVRIATITIVDQKKIVEEKHREILDSINYAERIQRSFLATSELLSENLKNYFVFFQPKDIVSGDFYWASKLANGNFALVTADSTGHGVPGAIMSILNISSLEKAVEQGLCEPSEILNHTRKTIIERLQKDGTADGGKDGMDCSFIRFDFKNNKLTYSAANSPIWVVRGKELLTFAPDKMPVGKHQKDTLAFTQHTVELQKQDMVYAFTDGMPDQFGGPSGKKFLHKQLKELLIGISQLPMEEQNQALQSALHNWKGDHEQVDDICVVGIRI